MTPLPLTPLQVAGLLLGTFVIAGVVLTAFTALYDHGVRKWGWPD